VTGDDQQLAKDYGHSINSKMIWILRKYIKNQKREQKGAGQQKDQA